MRTPLDMKTSITLLLTLLACLPTMATTPPRHWAVADGLPTDEVRQLIELPNGQILVNCEGAFCLSDGKGFQPLPCARNKTLRLPHYGNGYAHLWQGDTILWLRDFYRVYAFDPRTRTFLYDLEKRIQHKALRRFVEGQQHAQAWKEQLWHFVERNGLGSQATCAIRDRQNGVWVGTYTNGIFYFSPTRSRAQMLGHAPDLNQQTRQTTDSKGRIWHCRTDGLLCNDHGKETLYLADKLKGATEPQVNFIAELPDQRFLVCYNLHELGYFDPEQHTFTSLSDRLPQLARFRYFVGACPIDSRWTAIFTQNGAFLLDTRTDTLAEFPHKQTIEDFSDKYNCMLRDKNGNIFVGTQNGLFQLVPTDRSRSYRCIRVPRLPNNCIRSLVADTRGNVWAGTSCGISRITPTLVTLGVDDGVPETSMTERAVALTRSGHLAFACGNGILRFHPDSIISRKDTSTPLLTAMSIDEAPMPYADLTDNTLHLDHDQNYLTFQFSALNYASPSHIRYRYRLAGLEADWHLSPNTADGQCTVEYRALRPGTYTFEAQAAIDDSDWGAPLEKTFVIHPPLWQTWWMKLLYLLAAIAVGAYAIQLYLKRRKEKLEKENDQRVNKLFELREEARHQFAENVSIDAAKIAVNTEEEQLVQLMLKAIEAHMSDESYNVDQLARDVAMSRSALYARMRTMLGITPSDFIRNVRLKFAARLLAETRLPINEIAERVGYSTHKAFASNFKKTFGVIPSEYREPKRTAPSQEA